ncbi:Hint domain-containing protein [uncultured Tateyamaria sp.]|uniref:Hint domain-containing protein n=1 Tax=Tateyamaria sp. 1078 TaxID=3417464 RepID=UPI00261DAFA5|nr:Hint domain-containing protein [uncultured Tateyamaria sp.]
MADFLNGIFISEILADNAGGSAVDVDGDGNTNKADEYIELGNASGAPVSLDGYELWSEKNGALFAFDVNDVLNPGEAATVVGNYAGGDSGGFYDAGIAENGNFIPDGEGQKFDSIFLVDTNTGQYIVLSYGQPPRVPTLPTGFPGTTQVGSGESLNSNAPNGTAFARDANGNLIETTPTPGTPGIACFTAGTMILTRHGERPVETLAPGDGVPTYDNGMQRLVGICAQTIPPAALLRDPALRPLRVDGAPFDVTGSTLLSPAHCLLFQSAMAEALFECSEVLLRARHLELAGFARPELPRGGVTYYHLMFAEHEMVLADGFWSETFLNTGTDADEGAPDAKWQTENNLMRSHTRHATSARRILRGFEAAVLLDAPRSAKSRPDTGRATYIAMPDRQSGARAAR